MELDETGANVLSFLLFNEPCGFCRALEQDGTLASPATTLQLSNADRVTDPGKAFKERLDFRLFYAPRHAAQLGGDQCVGLERDITDRLRASRRHSSIC